MGLAMLQESLAAAAAAQAQRGDDQQQQQQQSGPSLQAVKESLSAAGAGSKRRKLPQVPARRRDGADAEGDDELDGMEGVPSFQLTFGEQGTVRADRVWPFACPLAERASV